MFFISKDKLQSLVDEMVSNSLAKYRDGEGKSAEGTIDWLVDKCINKATSSNFISKDQYDKDIALFLKQTNDLNRRLTIMDSKITYNGKPYISYNTEFHYLTIYVNDHKCYFPSFNISPITEGAEIISSKFTNVLNIAPNQYILTFAHEEYKAPSKWEDYYKDIFFLEITSDKIVIKSLHNESIPGEKYNHMENNVIILTIPPVIETSVAYINATSNDSAYTTDTGITTAYNSTKGEK